MGEKKISKYNEWGLQPDTTAMTLLSSPGVS